MKHFLFTLLLVLTLTSISEGHPIFTSEPLGSATLIDCNLSSAAACNVLIGGIANGRLLDIYSNLMNNPITDNSEPASPPFGVQAVLPYTGPCSPGVGTFAPCAVGGGQLTYVDNKADRELFLGATFKVNSGYGCSSVGSSKVYFMRTVDNLAGFAQVNGIFIIVGCGSTKIWKFGPNTGGLDNSHTCGSGGQICEANVGSGAITEGQWSKFEACVRSSSCNTCRDGVVRWWVNGVEAGRYTDMNYGSGNVNQFDWNQTWDGYGSGQGFTQTVAQITGHIYLSTPPSGGCASIAGGTPVTPPPPPPVGPTDNPVGNPSAPVGLIVSGLDELNLLEEFK